MDSVKVYTVGDVNSLISSVIHFDHFGADRKQIVPKRTISTPKLTSRKS